MLRIGVMLPRSNLFPAIGMDIIAGLKSFLKNAGLADAIKLSTSNIGFGLDDAEIYSKVEKHILDEDVDAILVVADAPISEMLEPLCASANKLLMMVNFGANFPANWQASDTVIHHSLNFSFLTRLTGQLAAKEAPGQALPYVVSYFDAGFRQCFSLMHGHQLAGGLPGLTHVTHVKRDEYNLEPLQQFLTENTAIKGILALAAGDMATDFYRGLQQVQHAVPLTVYAGPMLLDPSALPADDKPVQLPIVKGYASWLPEINHENNLYFIEQCRQLTGKNPNLFHVLGWDAGLLLEQINQASANGITAPKEIIQSIAGQSLPSPRGWMKLDPHTHYTYSATWLAEMNGSRDQLHITENDQTEAGWSAFTSDPFPPGDHSYWRNTYLCI